MKIEINGCHLNIVEKGQGTPTLIWTHGLMSCCAGELKAQIIPFEAISKQTKLIMYDARGHGESDDDLISANHVYEKLADDMLAIADHFKLDEFYLGGTSKGAATALWAATKSPDRVKGLILHTIPDAWQWHQQTANQHQMVLDALLQIGIEDFCEQLKQSPLPSSMIGLEEKREIDLEVLANHPTETATAILKGAIASDLPELDLLRKLQMNTLILSLSHMPGHSVEVAMQLENNLPHAELLVADSQDELKQLAINVLDFLK